MSKRHYFRRFLYITTLIIAFTTAIAVGSAYYYMEFRLPNVNILKDAKMQAPLRIYSNSGLLIAEFGGIRRQPVSIKQIPKALINAVLATEDARYYEHPGVDIIGIARAAVAVISTGRKVEGASTITMQVARNFFLSRKKTYGRKLREMLLAIKIDRHLSKNKVLELYLNKVYFGNHAYGVAAAAKIYYGKKLSELTLPEMAMIAGLPQAPSRNNPIINPTQALVRRNHVLNRMHDVGFISAVDLHNAQQAPITAKFHGQHTQLHAPYFAEMVRQVIKDDFGDKADQQGLSVYTTLTSTNQVAAQQALQNGLIAYSKRHGYRGPIANWGQPNEADPSQWQANLQKITAPAGLTAAVITGVQDQSLTAFLGDGTSVTIPWSGLRWARHQLPDGHVSFLPKTASDIAQVGDIVWIRQHANGKWSLSQQPKVQGALISINPQNGAILALTGGFSFEQSNFNRVTQALRQPGSGFKPFIYSAALNKNYTLASLINDAPIVIEDTGENALWRPHNDTNLFYGPTRLKVGLAKSRNLVSIRLLRAITIPYTLDYIKRFGFNPEQLPHTLSLALGSGVVAPMQMAKAYAVFANGGYPVTPFFINKVVNENNQVIYQAPINSPAPVITPQNAYLMNDALQSVINSGTGRAALKLKRHDLAGKTGTTNDQVDAWFNGFNTQVLATVWVGFDNQTPLHEYGSQAALPIWIDYMREALKGMPESTLPQPPGIVTVKIDSKTGLLAPPKDTHTLFEQFRQDLAPTEYSIISTGSTTHAPSKNQQADDDNAPIF